MNRAQKMCLSVLTLAASFLSGTLAWADGPPPRQMTRDDVAAAMRGPAKEATLADGALRLYAPASVTFIPAPEASQILQDIGAAPPSGTVVGGLAPTGAEPGKPGYRITLLTYWKVGHVPETGGEELGAMTFIDKVKAARPADGVISFLVTPVADTNAHVLTWTEKRAISGGEEARAEVRFLGRDSVAGMTTIAAAAQADDVAAAQPALMGMIAFAPGFSYLDFNAATDKISNYDLPALVTGSPKTNTAPVAPAVADAGATPFGFASLPGGWIPYAALGGGIVLAGLGFLVLRARASSAAFDVGDDEG